MRAGGRKCLLDLTAARSPCRMRNVLLTLRGLCSHQNYNSSALGSRSTMGFRCESLAFSGSTFCVITQFIIWRGRTEIKCLPILFFVFFFWACSSGNVNFGGFVLIMWDAFSTIAQEFIYLSNDNSKEMAFCIELQWCFGELSVKLIDDGVTARWTETPWIFVLSPGESGKSFT